MKVKSLNFKISWLAVFLFLSSCDFPYQPGQFVLPAVRSPFISGDSIKDFTGTSNVKIAYTLSEGSRWIYFVDFNQAVPVPIRLKKPSGKEGLNADSPLISPEDGSFVAYYLTHGADIQGAYFQGLDPAATPVLVAENGCDPHWWKDSLGQAYIVYSDQILTSALVPGINFTYRQKVSLSGGGSLIGPAEKIAPYPMNGGLSADGRFLCTGNSSAAFYDMADSTLISVNGDVQTCNPSIDPDPRGQGVMMFLNIDGPQKLDNPFLGNGDFPDPALPVHAILFIVDTRQTVIDYVPLALLNRHYGPYEEWQNPEWSNRPRFVCALGIISGDNSDIIIVKNVNDRSAEKQILRVTPGKYKMNYRSTPSLWIGE